MNTEDVLNQLGSDIVRLAKINLGATRVVDGRRRRIDNSGTLRNSLSYNVVMLPTGGYRVEIQMADYGINVDQGRKPGKGIPIAELKAWIKSKPIRLRDLKTGRFLPTTDRGINTLSFLINRKIREKGIAPTNFISQPLEKSLVNLDDRLQRALISDFAELLSKEKMNFKYLT